MGKLQKISKFLRKWNELLTLPLAIMLWVLSPAILRWTDPTAATYDSGIFQVILFGVIKFLVAHFAAWVLIKLTFPKYYHYLDDKFETDLTTLTPHSDITNHNSICVKLLVCFLLYALYLCAIIACMGAI